LVTLYQTLLRINLVTRSFVQGQISSPADHEFYHFGPDFSVLFKLHWIWSINSQENK